MGTIAFGSNGCNLLGRGFFHLAFAQLHLLLEQLLLPFCLLQAGVFLWVDLREAGQLLPHTPQFFLEVVGAAPFGLEGLAEAVLALGG